MSNLKKLNQLQVTFYNNTALIFTNGIPMAYFNENGLTQQYANLLRVTQNSEKLSLSGKISEFNLFSIL